MTPDLSPADVRAGRRVLRTMLAQGIVSALFVTSLLLRAGWFLATGGPLPGGEAITWVIVGVGVALLFYGASMTVRTGFGPHTPGVMWVTIIREAIEFLGGYMLIKASTVLIAAIRVAPVQVDLGFTTRVIGMALLGVALVLFGLIPPVIRHISEAAQVWHDLKTWPETALYMRRYGPGTPRKPRKPKRNQRQSGGKDSVQIQVGGDLKTGAVR